MRISQTAETVQGVAPSKKKPLSPTKNMIKNQTSDNNRTTLKNESKLLFGTINGKNEKHKKSHTLLYMYLRQSRKTSSGVPQQEGVLPTPTTTGVPQYAASPNVGSDGEGRSKAPSRPKTVEMQPR